MSTITDPHPPLPDCDCHACALVERDRLIDEVTRIKSWLEGDCTCPCCLGAMSCANDCTFAADCPQEAARMAATREALFGASNDQLYAAF